MGILLVVVFTTLLISAMCSLFEATLYSTRMSTLEALRAKGIKPELARRFLRMKRHIGGPIAAILILNTIANTAGATIAGMYAARVLGPSRVVLFSVVFTLGILFLSEIIPKTLGAVYWRQLWSLIVWPLTLIESMLFPAIYLTQKLTNLMTRGHRAIAVTEDEIIAMARLGAQVGEISEAESRMVRNIIKLENVKVRDIMTPRPVVFALEVNTTVAEALPLIHAKGFTRVPVYERDKERVIGYVRVQELSAAYVQAQGQRPLGEFLKPINFVPETVNCLSLLTTFVRQRWHIAIVADEYGGVAGLVTLEDLIETILGAEIVDESDREVDLRETARRRLPWLSTSWRPPAS